MATRKGKNISGHYVVHHKSNAFLYMYFVLKKMKGRTESYFILFLKLNGHPPRCFHFGLRRIHPNDCKVELN